MLLPVFIRFNTQEQPPGLLPSPFCCSHAPAISVIVSSTQQGWGFIHQGPVQHEIGSGCTPEQGGCALGQPLCFLSLPEFLGRSSGGAGDEQTHSRVERRGQSWEDQQTSIDLSISWPCRMAQQRARATTRAGEGPVAAPTGSRAHGRSLFLLPSCSPT